MSDKFKIGPWHIERNYKGSTQPDTWQFWHEDYDGAPMDSFGPPADNRCGFDRTLEDVLESIEAIEEKENA